MILSTIRSNFLRFSLLSPNLTSFFQAAGSRQGQLPSRFVKPGWWSAVHMWRICLLCMFWVSGRETGAAENPYRHGGMMLSDRSTVYFSPCRIFAGLTLATERVRSRISGGFLKNGTHPTTTTYIKKHSVHLYVKKQTNKQKNYSHHSPQTSTLEKMTCIK